MKRNAGAQAGESKLESRFAALTSGLLARKGFAAPSNSPIEDPAEETVAFTLEPTRKGDKKKDAAAAKAAPKAAPKPPAELKPAAKDANAGKPSQPEKAPEKPAEKRVEKQAEKQADKKPEPAAKAQPEEEIKLRASERAEPEPLKVINERSMEAGYPDNPSPEEIAALEAEADEVVSYFEKFGSDDAVELEKSDFYGDDAVADADEEVEADAADILDELDDLDDLEDEDDEPLAREGTTVAGPWAGASVPPVAAATEVKAGVTVQLTAREFMRLSLGAAELAQPAQELIVEAIEEYLDARGVLSLGGCSCLEALTKKPGDM
ncbi:MAG: hypothetical protein AB7F91_05785 [Parvularculaceae bacterium]